MATAGDGMAPYQSGGAGGKFRKRPIRRSAQATPYDRPPIALRNNSPSLLSKLVNPASRLIYAGADRLFGVFRKRLPSLPAQRPPESSEEQRNGIHEAVPIISTGVSKPITDEGGNLSTISPPTEISDLENMLKQKTFTRSEIERLTALLNSRTTDSDVSELDRSKIPNTTPGILRLEASTSVALNKLEEQRENFHSAISTHVVNSRVFEEDVASPAELAKAYMGKRPSNVSPSSALRLGSQPPRHDSALLNNTTVLPRTPMTSLTPRTATTSFKTLENGLTTPRSQGRSAIYNMARTPYYRPPSAFTQKGMASPSLALEGSVESSKMALKRRSSALDDIGSGGPVRRIRQKANLSSLSKNRTEIGSTSQKLLLRNEPEPKASKVIEENGVTSKHNLAFGSVPTKSTQMASKILEQLDRLSPKEKPSGSRHAGTNEKSPTKSTYNVDSPKFLQSSLDDKKSEGQNRNLLGDGRESTSQSKDKIEENGSRKFAVPRNVTSSMNGNSSNIINSESALKLPVEPPQKKRAFQMSAHEDYLDLDEEKHTNGHVSTASVENKKPATSVFANKDVSAQVAKTSSPEAEKITKMPEFKKVDASVSPPKTDVGPVKKHVGFNLPTSPPSGSNSQSAVISQSTSIAPQKEAPVFPTFGLSNKSGEKVSPFSFSANEPKPNASPDAKPLASSSLFNSVAKNDQVKFSASNKDNNGDAQKSVNMFSKAEEALSSSGTTTAPASGIFSFGGSTKNSSITNGSTTSSPSVFGSTSPIPAFGANNANKLFNSSSSSATTTTSAAASLPSATATASTSLFSTSAPAPVFSFGSAVPSSTSPTMAKAPENIVSKDNEPKSNALPFATTTSTTGGSLFGFSSPAAPSTTTASLFNTTSAITQAASTAVTQAAPFKFGSSSTTPASGASLFGSSAPSFGVASSENKSTASPTPTPTPTTTNNIFGGGFSSTPSFGLTSSTVTSSDAKSTTSTTTNVFGTSSTTWQQPPKSTPSFGSTFGSSPSTTFAFGASSTSTPSPPVVFGSSNTPASTGSSMFSFSATATPTNSAFPPPSPSQPIFGSSTPVFGAATSSPINNDQMSMEDSMAEDNTQTPSPSIPSFGQAPGFMFGAPTTTPSPSPSPFQFGGQANPFQASGSSQPPAQNPFQASGSAEFNAGGSFSLGSGGGDKSGRRILRVKSKNRRK